MQFKERQENDTDWNSFKRKVLFECPEGSVLEYPEIQNEQVKVSNQTELVLSLINF